MNIKRFRERRGITATRMAQLLGVGRKTYYNYENNQTDPPMATFIKICKILEISADEALDIQPEPLVFSEPTEEEARILRKASEILEYYAAKKAKK